jgi:hypothetical protein
MTRGARDAVIIGGAVVGVLLKTLATPTVRRFLRASSGWSGRLGGVESARGGGQDGRHVDRPPLRLPV